MASCFRDVDRKLVAVAELAGLARHAGDAMSEPLLDLHVQRKAYGGRAVRKDVSLQGACPSIPASARRAEEPRMTGRPWPVGDAGPTRASR